MKATSISLFWTDWRHLGNMWMDCNKNLAQVWNANGVLLFLYKLVLASMMTLKL